MLIPHQMKKVRLTTALMLHKHFILYPSSEIVFDGDRDMQSLPERIVFWLHQRGISDEVIVNFRLGWDGNRLVIPVFNEHGEKIFNKYRRDPACDPKDNRPKYTYESGCTSALYGTETIHDAKTIFIVEGELDALLLRSRGLLAVSSTGGAGTFKSEWARLLVDKEVYVFYDYDDAGIKGAFNVQQKIPWAKLAWPPKKDITEVYMDAPGSFERIVLQMMANAKTYSIPPKITEWPESKKEIEAIKQKLYGYQNELLAEKRSMQGGWTATRPIEILLDWTNDRYAEVARKLKFFRAVRTKSNDKIAAAKQVPVDMFVSVKNKFAKCVGHEEKTASMYWYAQENRVHCFGGCGFHGDVIDVVKKRDGVGTEEAIGIILGG